MGQGCTGGIISCVDCGLINTQELLSEPSRRFDASTYNQIHKNECREPVVNCIEKLDLPLVMYEKEFNGIEKVNKKEKKSYRLDESFKVGTSPRVKVISSNFSDKSYNLIDKIDKTAETDKSSSSIFYSSLSK